LPSGNLIKEAIKCANRNRKFLHEITLQLLAEGIFIVAIVFAQIVNATINSPILHFTANAFAFTFYLKDKFFIVDRFFPFP